MESRGATLEELLPVISGERGRKVWEEGDIDAGVVPSGQVIGLVHDVISVKEVIDGIIKGAKAILEKRLYPLTTG
jgi:nitronate monooxygenase